MNYETHTLLEYWSFHSKSVDEAWAMLEWLVGDTYKFEEVSCSLGMSLLDPSSFCARSYYAEHFVEPCAPLPQSLEYASSLYNSCQSS